MFWIFQHSDHVECPQCKSKGTYASNIAHLQNCELLRAYEIAYLSDKHHKAAKAVDEAWERNR